MDCPAPVICASIHHGLRPVGFDVTGYSREPDGSLQRLCDEHLERIEISEIDIADVLLCSFNGGAPRHLGILTELGERMYWIHANNNPHHGKVHEARLMFGPHRMKLVQAYRVRGLV